MNTLVIGDVILDTYLSGSVDRISPEAPVPVVRYESSTSFIGGAGNLAANLVAAGSNVTLACAIANDTNGEKLLELLDKSGVRVVNLSSTGSTIVKKRITDSSGIQIARIDYEKVNNYSPFVQQGFVKTISEQLEQDHFDYIVFSDYGKGLLTNCVIQTIIQEVKQRFPHVLVFGDTKIHPEGFEGAFLVKPNLKELSGWAKKRFESDEDILASIERLQNEYGIEHIVCTLGSRGAAFFDETGSIVSGKNRDVRDVSGAGDTFMAYLMVGYDKYKDIKAAIDLANKAAGIAVSKRGTSVVSLDETGSPCNSLASRRIGKTVVFTNGCFDVLHAGHVQLLTEAKKLGDILVVGLNSDESIQRLKGKGRPINPLADRKRILEALSPVDFVVPFSEDTPLNLIEELRPDVLVKGGDYAAEDIVGASYVTSYGGRVIIVPLLEGRSTTAIVEKTGKKH